MVTVIRAARRSPVLTPSTLACLSKLPTINLTAGCAHGCGYCYIQGYSGYPGEETIILYEDTLDRLRAELQRVRALPTAVFFSPSSDLFQPVPEVLDMAHEVLTLLLEKGIGVSILTKGRIPERTLALLTQHAELVRIQVGITTMDEALIAVVEPHTAPAELRVWQLAALTEAGIPAEARIDPVLPGLTDTVDSLHALFRALRNAGVRRAAVGVLFLRPAIIAALLRDQMRPFGVKLLQAYGQRDRVPIRSRSSLVQALPRARREQILAHVFDAARAHDVSVCICACKNPDLAVGTCGIAGRFPLRQVRAIQSPLISIA